MHRFYADQIPSGQDSEVLLSQEDARHALKVLRLRAGDPVEILVDGARYSAELCPPEKDRLAARLLSPLPSTEPRLRLTLFQGLPKADKMEWIIQKAVEIGVSRVVPVRMSRCVVRLEEADAARRLERWRRIAREAGKQSGRCLIPEIAPPVGLRDLPAEAAGLDACAVLWEEASGTGPLAFAREHPGLASLGLVVGPEGGIEPEEIRLLPEGCSCLTLGPRILRTETAGLAAAAAFLALYGEMEG